VIELSVVIPTYRRRDALPRALDALAAQTVSPDRFEAIVVDDPEDDDPAVVAECVQAGARPFEVRQISRPRWGVSAARNAGWRTARGGLVLFMNDDMLLRPDALAEHLETHAREPGEGVGVLGSIVWSSEIRVTPFMRWLEEGIQFDYDSLPGEEASWAHFYASHASVKRALLERVGGFDEERFPFLYEDLDIGYRMRDHGFRLLYNRRAVGEHLHATGIADWRKRMAATARAERTWVTAFPEHPAYFHDRFSEALEGPPGSRLAARAIGLVPKHAPLLGRRLWASADRWYSRQLAPAFLDAWRESAGEGPGSGPESAGEGPATPESAAEGPATPEGA
jgi:GT2 family glycosyltransferase